MTRMSDSEVAEALKGTILEFPLDGVTPLSSFEWILLRLLAEAKQILEAINAESWRGRDYIDDWLTRLQGDDE